MSAIRRQLFGPDEVAAALAAGEPVRLLLVAREPGDPRVAPVLERALQSGVRVHTASENMLWRLGKREPAAELLGLVGPDPAAEREALLAARGMLFGLVGTKYPGNTGFAIRLAEVAGADGIVVDNGFDHAARREAVRAAMRADRYFPVLWEPVLPLLADARAAGRRIFAIEDVGTAAPWEVDLRGPVVLLVGGEKHGLPPDVIEACDTTLRLPMHGFIPSYNLQAAMAMVTAERLRQLAQSDR